MHKKVAQHLIRDDKGRTFIEYDWFPRPLPANIELDDMSYPDTAYSFTTFFSKKPIGLTLGFASGNYGHSVFTTGENGEIRIGKYATIQCARIVSNLLVEIADYTMISWGAIISDSWITDDSMPLSLRREMLVNASRSNVRHLEYAEPKPVIIKENVWIGFEAVILPGVTIGRGSIIGSRTIVWEDVPPYAVVVGNPGRIVKYLEPTDTHEFERKVLSEIEIEGEGGGGGN